MDGNCAWCEVHDNKKFPIVLADAQNDPRDAHLDVIGVCCVPLVSLPVVDVGNRRDISDDDDVCGLVNRATSCVFCDNFPQLF